MARQIGTCSLPCPALSRYVVRCHLLRDPSVLSGTRAPHRSCQCQKWVTFTWRCPRRSSFEHLGHRRWWRSCLSGILYCIPLLFATDIPRTGIRHVNPLTTNSPLFPLLVPSRMVMRRNIQTHHECDRPLVSHACHVCSCHVYTRHQRHPGSLLLNCDKLTLKTVTLDA